MTKLLTEQELFPISIKELIEKQELIGIRLSGGTDSAVLLLTVLETFPKAKILLITLYNVLRPNALLAIKNIVDYANKKFPDRIVGHETQYFDSTNYNPINSSACTDNPKDLLQKEFIPSIFKKYNGKLKFLLSGTTLNPPIDTQKTFRLYPGNDFMESRNHKVSSLLKTFKLPGNEAELAYEYSPFRNSTKQIVAEWAKELRLVESLVPLTESCETPVDKYTKYAAWLSKSYEKPSIEPCQVCWPCNEKYWAYGFFDYKTPMK